MKLKCLFFWILIIINICLQFLSCDTIVISTNIHSVGRKVGASDLSIVIKEFGTNIVKSTVSWDTQIAGSGWQLANRYIEVSFACNYSNWFIIIYSSNTDANTGYQKGGLLSTTDNTSKLPVGWLVSNSTIPLSNISIGEPGEVFKSTITTKSGTMLGTWKYLKDKGDKDDPFTTAWNESWDSALNTGYVKIVYGGPDYANSNDGAAVNSPVVIYLECNFNDAQGGMHYQTTLYFDLIFF